MGALYATEVRSAFPFHWKHLDTVEWAAVVFWLCFAIFALTFLSREWAVQNIAVESEERLQDMISTMPPRGFIVDFSDYYDQCAKAIGVLEEISIPTSDQIRLVWTSQDSVDTSLRASRSFKILRTDTT